MPCVVQLGSSAGVTVVLDCGGADADVDPELLKHLTIISPNESELANLTGTALPRGHHLPQHAVTAIPDVCLASVALTGISLHQFCFSFACDSITTCAQYVGAICCHTKQWPGSYCHHSRCLLSTGS